MSCSKEAGLPWRGQSSAPCRRASTEQRTRGAEVVAVQARLLLGLALAEFEVTGDFDEAMALFDRAEHAVEESGSEALTASIHGQRALLHHRRGENVAALRAFDKAVLSFDAAPVYDQHDDPPQPQRAAPRPWRARRGVARTSSGASSWPSPRASRSSSSRRCTTSGTSSSWPGRLPRALKILEQAESRNPGDEHAVSLLDRARVLREAGLLDDAEKLLERASELLAESRVFQDLAETELRPCRVRAGGRRRQAGKGSRALGQPAVRPSAQPPVAAQGRADAAAGRPPGRRREDVGSARDGAARDRAAGIRPGHRVPTGRTPRPRAHGGAGRDGGPSPCATARRHASSSDEAVGPLARPAQGTRGAGAVCPQRRRAATRRRGGAQGPGRARLLPALVRLPGPPHRQRGPRICAGAARARDRLGEWFADRSARAHRAEPGGLDAAAQRAPPGRRDHGRAAERAARHRGDRSGPRGRRRFRERSWSGCVPGAWSWRRRSGLVPGSSRASAAPSSQHLVRVTSEPPLLRTASRSCPSPATTGAGSRWSSTVGGRPCTIWQISTKWRPSSNGSAPTSTCSPCRASRLPLAQAVRHSLDLGLGRLDALLVQPLGLGGRPAVLSCSGELLFLPWGLTPGRAGVPTVVTPSAAGWLQGRRRTRPTRPRVLAVAGPDLRLSASEATAVAATWEGGEALVGGAATAAKTRCWSGPERSPACRCTWSAPAREPALQLGPDGRRTAFCLRDRPCRRAWPGVSSCPRATPDWPRRDPATRTWVWQTFSSSWVSATVVAGVARINDEVSAGVMGKVHEDLVQGIDVSSSLATRLHETLSRHTPAALLCLGSGW